MTDTAFERQSIEFLTKQNTMAEKTPYLVVDKLGHVVAYFYDKKEAEEFISKNPMFRITELDISDSNEDIANDSLFDDNTIPF